MKKARVSAYDLLSVEVSRLPWGIIARTLMLENDSEEWKILGKLLALLHTLYSLQCKCTTKMHLPPTNKARARSRPRKFCNIICS